MPGHADYTMRLGLVPARALDRQCGGPSGGPRHLDRLPSGTSIGVRSGNSEWTTTRSLAHNRVDWHTLAVEITPKRIVWFVDAKVAAALDNRGRGARGAAGAELVLQGRPGGWR